MGNEKYLYLLKYFFTGLISVITTVTVLSEVKRKSQYINNVLLLVMGIPIIGLCAYAAYNILNLIF